MAAERRLFDVQAVETATDTTTAAEAAGHRHFDRQIYRRRNLVERCFNRLKGFGRIATRIGQARHLLRSSGQSCVIHTPGKIRLKTDPKGCHAMITFDCLRGAAGSRGG